MALIFQLFTLDDPGDWRLQPFAPVFSIGFPNPGFCGYTMEPQNLPWKRVVRIVGFAISLLVGRFTTMMIEWWVDNASNDTSRCHAFT